MALAYLLLGDMDKSFEYYEKAIANNISDVNGYKEYYNNMKQIAETKLKKSEQTV
jgi:tetratricopeptide (TPR) repeat protein